MSALRGGGPLICTALISTCSLCYAGHKLLSLPRYVATHIESLHLTQPMPSTDPYPGLKLPGNQVAALKHGTGSSRASNQSGKEVTTQYHQGRLFCPDTYSLGPATAVLAGALSMAAVGQSNTKVGASSMHTSHGYSWCLGSLGA
jgi:hypothetical protein